MLYRKSQKSENKIFKTSKDLKILFENLSFGYRPNSKNVFHQKISKNVFLKKCLERFITSLEILLLSYFIVFLFLKWFHFFFHNNLLIFYYFNKLLYYLCFFLYFANFYTIFVVFYTFYIDLLLH